jgi:hypothetical protein
MKSTITAVAATMALLEMAGLTRGAHAAYIMTLTQVGSDVVATGSGTINFTDLTSVGEFAAASPELIPSTGFVDMGPLPTTVDIDAYSGFSGPTSFGAGSGISANSGSGSDVEILGSIVVGVNTEPLIWVPHAYVSGTSLGTTTDTYDSTTLSALGATDGTYTWTWGTGPNADSFTLQVGPVSTAMPEPASALVFGLPVVATLLTRRRRK